MDADSGPSAGGHSTDHCKHAAAAHRPECEYQKRDVTWTGSFYEHRVYTDR